MANCSTYIALLNDLMFKIHFQSIFPMTDLNNDKKGRGFRNRRFLNLGIAKIGLKFHFEEHVNNNFWGESCKSLLGVLYHFRLGSLDLQSTYS